MVYILIEFVLHISKERIFFLYVNEINVYNIATVHAQGRVLAPPPPGNLKSKKKVITGNFKLQK